MVRLNYWIYEGSSRRKTCGILETGTRSRDLAASLEVSFGTNIRSLFRNLITGAMKITSDCKDRICLGRGRAR